ncbi:MAG: flagellar biosynthetic protein FliR [Cyanobacteria bacterium SIG28]|nr:flagellar biosynthetic protein FliR [Cyanobacteria bacterium SIG28]
MFNLDVLFSVGNIILFMAIFTRISGLFRTAPLLSTYPIPVQVKIWLAAAIAFILFPIVQHNTTTFVTPNSVPALTLILLKEYMIGYAIGYCANILFIGIEMGVNTFTIQMGLSADQALNPASGGTSPVITQAYTYLASMLFVALGAHQWLFAAIYNSFKSMPVGYIVSFSPNLIEQIIIVTSQIFSIGLAIAIPIFGILFITDVLLGFTSKMMPQMNIFMVSLPIKIYLGLILSLMFMRPMAEQIAIYIEQFLTKIAAIF